MNYTRKVLINLTLLIVILNPLFLVAKNNFNYSQNLLPNYSAEIVIPSDIDLNGNEDLVIINPSNGTINVAKNNGNYINQTIATSGINFTNTTWLTSTILINPNLKYFVKDVTGNNLPDVIIYSESMNPAIGVIQVCENHGNYFGAISTWSVFNKTLGSSEVFVNQFDSNPNGKNDILICNKVDGLSYLGSNSGTNFNMTLVCTLQNIANSKLNIGDFNFDGICDIIQVQSNDIAKVYLKNTNTGMFEYGGWNSNLANITVSKLFVEDFNNDQKQDILIFDQIHGKIHLLANNGNSSYTNTLWYDSPQLPALQITDAEVFHQPDLFDWTNLIVGDFSGDGKIDVLGGNLNNTVDGHLWMGFNTGTEFKFNEWDLTHSLAVSNSWNIIPCDLFSDGKKDILCLNNNNCKFGINAPVLEGYCWPLSAKPNETINFSVSGNGLQTITVEKYSSNDNSVVATQVTNVNISHQAKYISEMSWQNGCEWETSYTLTIPTNWESGFYGIRLTSMNGEVNYIPFVVKASNNKSCKRVALLANVNTWNAYNDWCGSEKDRDITYGYNNGSQNFSRSKYSPQYQSPANSGNWINFSKFTFLRPWPCARPNPELAVQTSGMHQAMGQLLRSELWIYTWLKDNGYEPDVITDIDLHNYPTQANSELNECNF